MVMRSRVRWFGWFVLCVGMVLGCYMMSARVGAERKRLDDVNRAILQTERSLKQLDTEFVTRANLVQLERWNDTLKLGAPGENQYVRDEAALAEINLDGDAPTGKRAATIKMAAVIPIVPAARLIPARALDRKLKPQSIDARAERAVKPRAEKVAMIDRRLLDQGALDALARRARTESNDR